MKNNNVAYVISIVSKNADDRLRSWHSVKLADVIVTMQPYASVKCQLSTSACNNKFTNYNLFS